MIAVSYHDRVNVLQAMGLASAAPFDRSEWFTLLAEEGGLEPLIAWRRTTPQAAALPLMRERGRLVPLANWYSFTWRRSRHLERTVRHCSTRDCRRAEGKRRPAGAVAAAG